MGCGWFVIGKSQHPVKDHSSWGHERLSLSIHAVSPQPADFYAAVIPRCFILHALNLYKSTIFFISFIYLFYRINHGRGRLYVFMIKRVPILVLNARLMCCGGNTQASRLNSRLQIGRPECPSDVGKHQAAMWSRCEWVGCHTLQVAYPLTRGSRNKATLFPFGMQQHPHSLVIIQVQF